MKNVWEALHAYHIKPTEITPVTKRLYQVQSQGNTYALKRSRMNPMQLQRWKRVFQTANEHRLHTIMPIYTTRSGDISYHSDQDVYYLTPWKYHRENDEPEHEVESFYQAIGMVHYYTKQKSTTNSTRTEHLIQKEKEYIKQERERLLSYVQRFEQRHYMSPFELRVCMQYRDLDQVFRQLDNWLDYYIEDIAEDKAIATCLCHGNLRASHKIYQTSNTYLINWEHSYFGSPVSDLASYFFHEFKYHDCLLEQLLQSFSVYEKYNPLQASERSLLSIYMLTPRNYLRVIENYTSGTWHKSQPFQIKKLEQAYRVLMHGLTIQDHLYQIRQKLQAEAEEQTDQQD